MGHDDTSTLDRRTTALEATAGRIERKLDLLEKQIMGLLTDEERAEVEALAVERRAARR